MKITDKTIIKVFKRLTMLGIGTALIITGIICSVFPFIPGFLILIPGIGFVVRAFGYKEDDIEPLKRTNEFADNYKNKALTYLKKLLFRFPFF